MDTIVALSSGRPPAAIGVVRISGPIALGAVERLAGRLPTARQAGLRAMRDAAGELLDRALVLVFPGPDSATGEDLVEVQCHGGRAVVQAIEAALIDQTGVRAAEPGEFTRRALLNGRIDLAEAEGLADLLEAETEGQRRAALQASEGQVSRAIRGWLDRLSAIAAQIEAIIDFADDDDVADADGLFAAAVAQAAALRAEMEAVLAAPPVERVCDGVRVVIGGPPNSGKSTLLNLLVARDAAIVSPFAGTTRDRVEAILQRRGRAYVLTDTAGLTDATDPVERIGVERANAAIAGADLVLWLADTPPARADAIWVHARADLPDREIVPAGRVLAIAQNRPASIDRLWEVVHDRATSLLPTADDLPLKKAQREAVADAVLNLALDSDVLIAAEQLRVARVRLASVLGQDATEAMLDAMFGRFCLGK